MVRVSPYVEVRFESGMTAKLIGVVAQLGERCVRIAEVEGSIPFNSTMNSGSHDQNRRAERLLDHRGVKGTGGEASALSVGVGMRGKGPLQYA